MNDSKGEFIFVLASIVTTLLVAYVCHESVSSVSDTSSVHQTYTYECIDKKEAVGSHYNLLTGKQVVDTEYFIILRDTHTSEIVTHEISLKEYYTYKVGTVYTFHSPLY